MSRLLVADRQSISKDVSSSTLHIEWERGPADVLSLSVLSGLMFLLCPVPVLLFESLEGRKEGSKIWPRD